MHLLWNQPLALDVPWLRDATTLHVGGTVSAWVLAGTEQAFIDAVRNADRDGRPLLVLGGGSNLLASDEPFDGIVVQDARREIRTRGEDRADGVVTVTSPAGTAWDDLVAATVEQGLSGLEALSGIPGTVGAAPVQNVGAYGQDVAATLVSVRAWDRAFDQIAELTAEHLRLGYRTSVIKRSLAGPQSAPEESAGRQWGPTGRWVITEATFALPASGLSAPVQYAELARALGVSIGDRAPASEVREAVLALRRSKGMVVDPDDHDTWSAGSFFTNPILRAEAADALLPPEAPRFPAGRDQDGAPLVKTSAAWLISRSGFGKGYAVPSSSRGDEGDPAVSPADILRKTPRSPLPGEDPDAPRASLSTKHVLALTNRGRASSHDIEVLARTVREGVRDAFGIELVPEPVTLGIDL